jgi:hypothetical protein
LGGRYVLGHGCAALLALQRRDIFILFSVPNATLIWWSLSMSVHAYLAPRWRWENAGNRGEMLFCEMQVVRRKLN